MTKKVFFIFLILLISPFTWSEEQNINITNQQQVITAPALVPSDAQKLRKAREKQEIETEDSILKELEKQRLIDEQKRKDKLFGNTSDGELEPQAESSAPPVTAQNDSWFFKNQSFISLGLGVVGFPGTGVNSTEALFNIAPLPPAGFISFGGYAYKGHLIFDMSLYYSRHYLKEIEDGTSSNNKMTHQPALALSVKYSPLTSRMKPYVGISGSILGRKWQEVNKAGESTLTEEEKIENRDVGNKEWYLSLDAGLAVGADIAIQKHFGVNIDIRYHWNIYTENSRKETDPEDIGILDEQNSFILSANAKYYF